MAFTSIAVFGLKGSLLLAIVAGVATAPAQNLVNNGDFEQVNAGFTSSYFNGTPFWNLTEEGCIFVGTDPGPLNDYFVNGSLSPDIGFTFYDHTSGNATGHMLMGNGNSNSAATVWQTTSSVSVVAGQPYRFSAYISNINAWTASDEMPALSFQLSLDNGINWQPLATSAAPTSPGIWYLTEKDGTFASASSSVGLRLLNAQTSLGGNDFAIDDIYFGLTASAPDVGTNPYNSANSTSFTGTVPEPSTLALTMVGSMGGLLLFCRRKN